MAMDESSFGVSRPDGPDPDHHSQSRLQPARRWSWTPAGHRCRCALSVLELLEQQNWSDQISAIDLMHYEHSGNVILITDTQSRIIWGSAPGEEDALEALADRKLERLTWLHEHHGRIDQHHRGEIDVTDSSVVTKR